MATSPEPLLVARGEEDLAVLPGLANRHGLVAGATGTGKTVTLRVLAEGFSRIGVPVFLADVKGDLAGMTIPGVERDLERVIKGLDTRYTNEAADRLREFDKPALIAWSREDRFFKPAHAQRLAHDLPNARLEWIENARSLSPEDEPGRLAELIAGFVREPGPRATA